MVHDTYITIVLILVYDTYNSIFQGLHKPKNITLTIGFKGVIDPTCNYGAPHCRHLLDSKNSANMSEDHLRPLTAIGL